MPGTVTGSPESSATTRPIAGASLLGIAVPENDILHCFGRNAGSVEQPGESGDAELDGVLRLEHSAVAADRRPNRLTDHGSRAALTGAARRSPRGRFRSCTTTDRWRGTVRPWRPRSGSPARPIGISANFSSQIRCGMASVIADLIKPGLDRVDPDTEVGEFLGSRLGHADDAGLGRRIVGLADHADLPGDRRHVHDRAALVLPHDRRGLAQARSRSPSDARR